MEAIFLDQTNEPFVCLPVSRPICREPCRRPVGRVLLTSMVSCLFAREVYKEPLLADCLRSVGYGSMAGQLGELGRRIQELRWQTRLATGYDPRRVKIPKRFTEVTTWKEPVDREYMETLRRRYAEAIMALGQEKGLEEAS